MTLVPEIILGPPGCGKTTTLLNIVDEELTKGTPPDRIAYVSFTRRAAEEASTRAAAKFNLTKQQLPFFRTLHSLCYRQLGLQRGDVFEDKRLKEFADYAGIRMSGGFSEDGSLVGYELGDRALHMINLSRVRLRHLRDQYDRDDDGLPWSEVSRINSALLAFKSAHGLLDYTDMLQQVSVADLRLGIDVLIVDEVQDQSRLQWKVVDNLAQRCRRLVVAGDDDQAIYRWAGASINHFVNLEGTVSVLGQSYRVPPVLQGLASGLISPIIKRRGKEWAARPGEQGSVGLEQEFSRADCGAGEILILARNTYLLRELVEPELRRQGLVYERHGYSSIKPQLLAAITDWEALRAGKSIPVTDAKKVYEYMSAGTGVRRGFKTLGQFGEDEQVNIETLHDKGGLLVNTIWHEALDRLPRNEMAYILAARRRGEKLNDRPRIRLSTIHGAKGGEADHVVLLREMAKRTHGEMGKSQAAEDDERRVWYVAVTRARSKLTVVNSRTNLAVPWL